MSDDAANIEDLLRRAFRPVEPPEHLPDRFENTVLTLASFAAGELEGLEPDALRDPRNWGRQATAVAAGGVAAAALVAYELKRRGARNEKNRGELRGLVRRLRSNKQSSGYQAFSDRAAELGANAGEVLRDLADEVRRLRHE